MTHILTKFRLRHGLIIIIRLMKTEDHSHTVVLQFNSVDESKSQQFNTT